MKNKIALLSLALVAFGTVSTVNTKPAFSQTTNICPSSPVPTGWVVTGTFTSFSQCGNSSSFNNMRTITRADGNRSLNICPSSPVPTGWVVTGTFTSFSQCGNSSSFNNMRTITRLF